MVSEPCSRNNKVDFYVKELTSVKGRFEGIFFGAYLPVGGFFFNS